MIKVIVLTSFLLLHTVTASVAQGVAKEGVTPEEIAQSYLAAFMDSRFDDAVRYMHPDVVADFRATMIPLIDASIEQDQERQALRLFPGVANAKVLKKLDAERLFSLFLAGRMGTGDAEERAILATIRIHVLGHVMEGDTAHVIYRLSLVVDGKPRSNVIPVSLRRSKGGWGVLLDRAMEMSIQSFRFILGKDETWNRE